MYRQSTAMLKFETLRYVEPGCPEQMNEKSFRKCHLLLFRSSPFSNLVSSATLGNIAAISTTSVYLGLHTRGTRRQRRILPVAILEIGLDSCAKRLWNRRNLDETDCSGIVFFLPPIDGQCFRIVKSITKPIKNL